MSLSSLSLIAELQLNAFFSYRASISVKPEFKPRVSKDKAKFKKKAADDSAYRDRAAERRTGGPNDFADAEKLLEVSPSCPALPGAVVRGADLRLLRTVVGLQSPRRGSRGRQDCTGGPDALPRTLPWPPLPLRRALVDPILSHSHLNLTREETPSIPSWSKDSTWPSSSE